MATAIPSSWTTSPGTLARLGGLLYLITIVMGLFREIYVKGRIVVPGDIAATATMLVECEFLWRAGVAAELVMVLCSLVLTWVLYILLKPTDRHLALLMACFGFTALAVEAACSVLLVQALLPISSTSLRTADPALRHALIGMALRGHENGFGIALLLFGPFFLAAGALIWRSGVFPRFVGVLYLISGVGYLIHSFVLILLPGAAAAVFAVVALPIFVGEVTFCLWLLLRGLDEEAWNETALRAAAP